MEDGRNGCFCFCFCLCLSVSFPSEETDRQRHAHAFGRQKRAFGQKTIPVFFFIFFQLEYRVKFVSFCQYARPSESCDSSFFFFLRKNFTGA